MSLLELPHTAGCLVCGQDNPHGLHLTSRVDPDSGVVQTTFTPLAHHIGFENIIHGGVLATVLDELMVWCAIWASGQACVAAELSLRFVRKVSVGQPLQATAWVTRRRSRLIETAAELHGGSGMVCTGTAKYALLNSAETKAFLKTFINDDSTAKAAEHLRNAFSRNQGEFFKSDK